MKPIENPNDISAFRKLGGVEVQTATASGDFIKNVRINLKRELPKLPDIPGFLEVKGHNKPIGLIGGGPSIKKELDNIRDFKLAGFPIIACGSSHDYLISQGIMPEYCTLCDPDPITAEYIKKHHKDVKYLVALSCDSLVFERLKDRQVYVWNCRSDEAAEEIKKDLVGHIDILGGCTVGLRSMSIAMCFGHTNVHLWGYDSCMGENSEHHAYEFETDKELIGDIYPIRFGESNSDKPDEGGRYYMCSGYQLAQAMHFMEFLKAYGKAFTPTFHGGGMMSDFYDYLRSKMMTERKAA